MRRSYTNGALLGVLGGLLASCHHIREDLVEDDQLCADAPLQSVQMIGSHNSYRQLPPPPVLAEIERMRPGLVEKLEYEHPPLAHQLDLGLRLLELDFYWDPRGGLYADPPNSAVLSKSDRAPYSAAEAQEPGFKVMHIQGYDNYSHCVQLRDCLMSLRNWSDANPDHSLITVTMNVKEDRVFDGLPTPPRFDAGALSDLDNMLRKIFGDGRLLTPDVVRGEFPTLRDAVRNAGWPTLSKTKQKFMFVLDEGVPRASLIYREGHPSLRGRAMFANYPETDDEAAFMVFWDIKGQESTVADMVSKGFLVRVSADIGTREARLNDRSRLERAIESGAQFIASDYYPGNISPFDSTYIASFRDGSIMRCSE